MNTVLLAVPSVAPGGLNAPMSGHFGHCDAYTLVTLTEGKTEKIEVLPNMPHQQGGCMAPVRLLAEHKVKVLLAGGMGMRPLMAFQQEGIEVFFAGGLLDVEQAVHAFINGKLLPFGSEQVCGGGGHCHGHNKA